jgi:hypothetical protein
VKNSLSRICANNSDDQFYVDDNNNITYGDFKQRLEICFKQLEEFNVVPSAIVVVKGEFSI